MKTNTTGTFTCPWWLLFTFDNPLRKLVHDPGRILGAYVNPGDTVLDVGCGMGYFTLGLAELVGEKSHIIAADLQEKMLVGLQKRAERTNLLSHIQLHRTEPDRIGVEGTFDFVLAFWMVHEVRDQTVFLREIYEVLKPAGKLLIVEPKIHVSGEAFNETVMRAKGIGLLDVDRPRVRLSRSVLFQK
jgi:ubiquinone/menaquinone biosynthesis C-methylase UbiE